MKKFIGTKVIMAEPMTMAEAQKVLGREIKPATIEEDGYLVEYKDGYKSWSPKEVFDKAYKPFEDFKDRLHIELDELEDRLTKLNVALGKDGFREKVGDYQFKLMKEQSLAMAAYKKALGERYDDLFSRGRYRVHTLA